MRCALILFAALVSGCAATEYQLEQDAAYKRTADRETARRMLEALDQASSPEFEAAIRAAKPGVPR